MVETIKRTVERRTCCYLEQLISSGDRIEKKLDKKKSARFGLDQWLKEHTDITYSF